MKTYLNYCIKSSTIILLTLLVSACSSVCCDSCKSDVKVTKLFNGKNLDGWTTYIKGRGINNDPKGVFTVKDGAIRVSGEEWGGITSDKEFENYKITIEYKWGELTWGERAKKARDSGFLFASTGEFGSFSKLWMNSIEVNIIEGGTGEFWMVTNKIPNYSLTTTVSDKLSQSGKDRIFDPNGKSYTMYNNSDRAIFRLGHDGVFENVKGFRAKNEVENPHGEWNKLECEIKDGMIKVFLNGKFVNQAKFTPTKGKIQFQSEGSEIFYRKIDIIEL